MNATENEVATICGICQSKDGLQKLNCSVGRRSSSFLFSFIFLILEQFILFFLFLLFIQRASFLQISQTMCNLFQLPVMQSPWIWLRSLLFVLFFFGFSSFVLPYYPCLVLLQPLLLLLLLLSKYCLPFTNLVSTLALSNWTETTIQFALRKRIDRKLFNCWWFFPYNPVNCNNNSRCSPCLERKLPSLVS